MREKIEIRLPSELLDSPDAERLKDGLKDVQDYFDETAIDLEEDTISFFFLQGQYEHINRSTTIMGVFISTLPIPALAFRGVVTLKCAESGEERAEIEVAFPHSFMGEFSPNEGIFTCFTMPTDGLTQDTVFETTEFVAQFSDIEYVAIDSGDDSLVGEIITE